MILAEEAPQAAEASPTSDSAHDCKEAADIDGYCTVCNTKVKAINQCDGCRAGVPLQGNTHVPANARPWDGSRQVCTAARYGHKPS